MLRSDLHDYNHACIVVKGTIDLLDAAANENNKAQKNVVFKNNAPFRSCISNINSTLIDNGYSQNYYMTSGTLQNYYRDETDDVNDNASDGKLFKYKIKIVGKTPEWPGQLPQPPKNPDGTQPPQPQQPTVPTLNVEATIPFKYLSNFWRFFDLPPINCEIELDLSGTKDCVLCQNITIT